MSLEHKYSGNNLEPGADLTDANLADATFSTSTILNDNQTISEHCFDVIGLQAYLEETLGATYASDLSLVLSGDFNNDNTVNLALSCLAIAAYHHTSAASGNRSVR